MIPFVLDKPHSALYAQSGCPTNGCKGYSQFSLDLSPKTWSTWSDCGCQVDAHSRTREVCNSLETKLTKELETEPCYLSRKDSWQITDSRFDFRLNHTWISVKAVRKFWTRVTIATMLFTTRLCRPIVKYLQKRRVIATTEFVWTSICFWTHLQKYRKILSIGILFCILEPVLC